MTKFQSYSDVTFIVEDNKEIPAHKIILQRCPYFAAMFNSEMREKHQSKIRIENFSYKVFYSIIKYIYTDNCEINLEVSKLFIYQFTLQNAMELFEAADIFGIDRLKIMCEHAIMASIDINNSAQIFLASDMHNAQGLRERALNFILQNFDQVSKTAGFE